MRKNAIIENQVVEIGDTVKYFAVFLPMKDVDKSVIFRVKHLQFLTDCRSEGKLLASGRFTDGSGGLVIYKGKSQEQVESWVRQDPYIIKGARDFNIQEWEAVFS